MKCILIFLFIGCIADRDFYPGWSILKTKRSSEFVNQRRTDNIMQKAKKSKEQTTFYKILHMEIKIWSELTCCGRVRISCSTSDTQTIQTKHKNTTLYVVLSYQHTYILNVIEVVINVYPLGESREKSLLSLS
jgi:hypothetical protein